MQTRSSPSMNILHTLAHDAGIKHYAHIPKTELYHLLTRHYSLDQVRLHLQQCDADSKSTSNMSSHRIETDLDVAFTSHGKDTMTGRTATTVDRSKMNPLQVEKRELMETWKNMEEQKQRQQRWWGNVKVVKRKELNTIDPIMLTEIGPFPFCFTRPNGSEIAYDAEVLAKYMLSTGDFAEPETRLLLTENDLERLDYTCKKAGVSCDSVVEAKRNHHKYAQLKIQRDGLFGLERCAGEEVTGMLHVIEGQMDPEEGELKLVMSIFPNFADLYTQISSIDLEFAKQSMLHYRLFVNGPKNKATEDLFGFLPIVMRFLRQVESGEYDSSLYGF